MHNSSALRRALLVLVAFALVAAACGGDDEATTTTTTTSTTVAPTTTSTVPPTTTTVAPTTTVFAGPMSPINGLPVEAQDEVDRRVIAVKIDNHPSARPQSGLEQADAVYELLVEGGLTRFVALFHDNDTEYLGPIRSGRPTDAELVGYLDATFNISGASGWIIRYLANRDIHMLGEGSGSFRISGRRAPHNLYGNTADMREFADSNGYPDEAPQPMFEFGNVELEGEDATSISLDFSSDWPNVNYEWDGERYLRSNGSTPFWTMDRDGEQAQLAFDTVIVIFGRRYTSAPSDPSQGVAVPATDTVGEGRALVFAQGKAVEGRWSRDDRLVPFALTDAEGEPIIVPPGVPYIAIFPDSRSVTWE